MQYVLEKAVAYSKQGIYNIDGVVFGSDDFLADVGKHDNFELIEEFELNEIWSEMALLNC